MVCSIQGSDRCTSRFRDATPTPYSTAHTTGPCHTLQAIKHPAETTGGSKKTVETLTEQVGQQHRTIRWMSRALWMAGGALVVPAPIAGWLSNHRFDEISNALAKGGG